MLGMGRKETKRHVEELPNNWFFHYLSRARSTTFGACLVSEGFRCGHQRDDLPVQGRLLGDQRMSAMADVSRYFLAT